MQGISKVIVIGNLGRRPELRHTNSGKAVGNFSVAVNEGKGDDQTTEWIPVVVWEKTAEVCHEYLDKGSPVYVEGRWETQKWEDRDGNKRSKVQVVAHKVIFLGQSGAGSQDGEGPRDAEGQDGGDDADIPF